MGLKQYLDVVAAQLVNELKPILEIKGVTAAPSQTNQKQKPAN
jgi:hypothetical protein